jgi:hypothetical protein
MKHISKQEALTKINSSNGRVFGVVFEKADGTMRKMSGRIDVTKHLKGGVATYRGKDGSKQNVGLYEMAGTKSGYKCFSLDRLKEIHIDNEEYVVEG